MTQVKVYGRASHLVPMREALSGLIHRCLMEAFGLPREKRFQRFFPMADEDWLCPEDRTERYTILEISLFEGRSAESKKRLIRLLFERAEQELALPNTDLEITLFETPRANWGIRGQPGDELALTYKVDV